MLKRAPCPVVTCTFDMPANWPMCTTCWESVPGTLRKQIYLKAPGSQSYKDLVSQAARMVQQARAEATKVAS